MHSPELKEITTLAGVRDERHFVRDASGHTPTKYKAQHVGVRPPNHCHSADMASRLWHMNADFEVELAAPAGAYRRPPHYEILNRRLSEHLLWRAFNARHHPPRIQRD